MKKVILILILLISASANAVQAIQYDDPPKEITKSIINKCEKDYPDNYNLQSFCVNIEFKNYWVLFDLKARLGGKK